MNARQVIRTTSVQIHTISVIRVLLTLLLASPPTVGVMIWNTDDTDATDLWYRENRLWI